MSNEERIINACFNNDIDSVIKLVNLRIDLNFQDRRGMTPLICAIEQGNFELIKILIENGADINYSGHLGWTPIHHAVDCWYDEVKDGTKDGDIEIIKYLVKNGADVLKRNDVGESSIDIARSINFKKAINYLVSLNIDEKK